MIEKPPVPIVIVAAVAKDSRVIGNNNTLLWHIPDDLKRFKALTLGHPVIMGRKTFDSILAILGRPLPKRTTIILTHNPDLTSDYDDVVVAHSFQTALDAALTTNPDEIHIGGGAELYRQALPYVDRLHLTLVDDNPPGDSYFPEYEDQFTAVTMHPTQSHQDLTYQWVDYERNATLN